MIPSQFMIKNRIKNAHVLKRYCNSEPFRKFKGQPFRFFPLVLRILIKPQLPFNILVKEIQHPAFTLSYQIRRRNIYLKSISVSWIVCAIRPESLPLIVIEFFAVILDIKKIRIIDQRKRSPRLFHFSPYYFVGSRRDRSHPRHVQQIQFLFLLKQ